MFLTFFQCQDLCDYHDLRFKIETLFLVCVAKEHSRVSHETYNLDSNQNFTYSHLSGDAFVRVCNAVNELLTDPDQLEMLENMIHTGTSSVF